MLKVLAEMNCLKSLNKLGIYPDDFYTDFVEFKNNTSMFVEDTVLIIASGICSFNRKHLVDLAKSLKRREEDPNDKGVVKVIVISDSDLPNLKGYYKFTNSLDNLVSKDGWKERGEGKDVLLSLQSPPKKSTLHLSRRHRGECADLVEAYKNHGNKEDEYCKIIQVPDVKKMLHNS